VILGLPGEGPAEREASLDFCARAALVGGVNVSLHLVNPQPGCGLGAEFGGEARPVEGVPPDMARGAGETAAERAWIARHPDLFTTFALLPGDADEQRALARLSVELPEVLHRYPRTFALLRRDGNLGALELHRAWSASGRSFEAYARARRDTQVDDVLACEQAAVRAAAGADRPRSRGPRARGARVAVRSDVPRIYAALRAGAERVGAGGVPAGASGVPAGAGGVPLGAGAGLVGAGAGPPRDGAPGWIAAVPAPGRRALLGTRTLSISADAARLLDALDGTRTRAELERAHPGIGAALERLAHAGLIEDGSEDRPAAAREESTP
jgi:hypothetical protein